MVNSGGAAGPRTSEAMASPIKSEDHRVANTCQIFPLRFVIHVPVDPLPEVFRLAYCQLASEGRCWGLKKWQLKSRSNSTMMSLEFGFPLPRRLVGGWEPRAISCKYSKYWYANFRCRESLKLIAKASAASLKFTYAVWKQLAGRSMHNCRFPRTTRFPDGVSLGCW